MHARSFRRTTLPAVAFFPRFLASFGVEESPGTCTSAQAAPNPQGPASKQPRRYTQMSFGNQNQVSSCGLGMPRVYARACGFVDA